MQEQILENPGRGLATVKQAASYLRLSVAKIYVLMSAGELDSVRIGKSRRITWKALDELIQRSTVSRQ